MNREGVENLNRSISSKDFESVIKNLPTKQSPGSSGFSGEMLPNIQRRININITLLKLLNNRSREDIYKLIL